MISSREFHEKIYATPVIALNRAVAAAEVGDPARALAAVDELEPELESYYPFYTTRASLLRRLGRPQDAATAYERASELAPTEAERMFLRESALAARLGTDAAVR